MADKFVSKYTSTEFEEMLDKIKQDMTIIQYTQNEINTLLTKIRDVQLPTKLSDLADDSDFIKNTVSNLINYYTKTEVYNKNEINTMINQQTSGGFVSVEELPTENISTRIIYLVPSTTAKTKNIKDEYINLDGTTDGWELIGNTKVDLSGYIKTNDLNTVLSDYLLSSDFQLALESYYTKTEIDNLINEIEPGTSLTAGNGINIENDEISVDEMPSDDMNEIVFPLPFGGKVNAETGYTPVGTIISVMGTTAPRHYLACNGQIVNITSYPELANYFESQFGTKNHFGGDGTTTFGIPDLRGEFLRGTGTNSHLIPDTEFLEGSGANVGEHQAATQITRIDGDTTTLYTHFGSSWKDLNKNPDRFISIGASAQTQNFNVTANRTQNGADHSFTSRPTNTSVLYCIATKNIYIDAKYQYSLDEEVVGTWIDGKPVYQIITIDPFLYAAPTIDYASDISNFAVSGPNMKIENNILTTWPASGSAESLLKYTLPISPVGSLTITTKDMNGTSTGTFFGYYLGTSVGAKDITKTSIGMGSKVTTIDLLQYSSYSNIYLSFIVELYAGHNTTIRITSILHEVPGDLPNIDYILIDNQKIKKNDPTDVNDIYYLNQYTKTTD